MRIEIENKLKEMLGSDVVNQVKDSINSIENSIPTTKNHYGQYMAILSKYEDKQKQIGLAKILIALGGNQQGILDAIKLI